MRESNITYREFGLRFKISSLGTLVTVSKNIYKSRSLIWQLFKRDFMTANKRSYLGIFWSFFMPLLGIVSWLIMQIGGVLKPGEIGVPFPIYVLSGSLIYSYFFNFITCSRNTLSSGASFIMQVEYSHEALWAYNLLTSFFWAFIALIFNIIVMMFFGLKIRVEWFLIPFLLLPSFFLGSSIGFLLLVFDKAIPDLSKIIDIGLGLFYWITPIVYTISAITNEYILLFIKINPLYYLTVVPRDIFLFGKTDLWVPYGIVSFISLLFFLMCLRFYYIMEEIIVERI